MLLSKALVLKSMSQTLLSGLSNSKKRNAKKALTEDELLQLVGLDVLPAQLEEYYRLVNRMKENIITDSEYTD
jgi:hypothetical protein